MKREPVSESLMVGLLLALAGGMLDAYSFINRGEVFATAETGNIVRLSIYLSMGEWREAFHYLLPILAFALGVIAAEALRRRSECRAGRPDRRPGRLRWQWQQPLLLAECGVLAAVSLLPLGPLDPLANILIAFSSAVQVDSFRKFRGCTGSTTMCTGNLRSGTELLFRFLVLPDPQAGEKASVYYRLILAFILGAVLCGRLSLLLGGRTAAVVCVPLLLAFALMFRRENRPDPAGFQP